MTDSKPADPARPETASPPTSLPGTTSPEASPSAPRAASTSPLPRALPKEIGGAKGPEPTRYGDWEHKGRCTDF